jgi:hypothetical protein
MLIASNPLDILASRDIDVLPSTPFYFTDMSNMSTYSLTIFRATSNIEHGNVERFTHVGQSHAQKVKGCALECHSHYSLA